MKSINLLPPKHAPSRNPKLPLLLVVLFLTAAAFLVYQTFAWKTLADAKAAQSLQLENESKSLQENGVPIADLQLQNQAAQLIEGLEKNRVHWTPYFNAIFNPLKGDSRIIAASLNEQSMLTIEIDFNVEEQAVAYIRALENDPLLKELTIRSYNENADSNLTASVSTDGAVAQIRKTSYKLIVELSLATEEGGEASGNGN
ncbi:hypothetical protein ACFQZE_01440 [Paenibacillus sp. GCM10027627]|uniref:hypothetical protein n=1 Tax=unclassified Paenibacillus TaxID=185978 RepID=UPI00363BB2F6